MEKVWVLTALFTGDNKDSLLEVIGVYKRLDEAETVMKFHHEDTKEEWLNEGIKGEEILDLRLNWCYILKLTNSYKQVKLEIHEENIEDDWTFYCICRRKETSSTIKKN